MNQHKFQRIDAGTPRGAKQARAKDGKILPLISAEQKQEIVRDAVRDMQLGFSFRDIAKKHNVSGPTIYSWVLGGIGDKAHHELITGALVTRVHDADELLRTADNPLDIARAREMARFSRMDLERRRPHLYGPKQEITHTLQPVLNITVANHSQQIGAGNVIEGKHAERRDDPPYIAPAHEAIAAPQPPQRNTPIMDVDQQGNVVESGS